MSGAQGLALQVLVAGDWWPRPGQRVRMQCASQPTLDCTYRSFSRRPLMEMLCSKRWLCTHLEHVWDHQQQALGAGEAGDQGPGGQGTVNGTWAC